MAVSNFAGDFRSMEERNADFLITATSQRFEDYVKLVTEKNIHINIPKLVPDYDDKEVHEYVKNLLLCCTENHICYESFMTLFINFFKDGFNLAMNTRISGTIDGKELR